MIFISFRIAEWVSKQAEREREKERQKQLRMERKRQMPKHTFDDATYTQHIQETSERIEDALQQGQTFSYFHICCSCCSLSFISKKIIIFWKPPTVFIFLPFGNHQNQCLSIPFFHPSILLSLRVLLVLKARLCSSSAWWP